MLGSLRGAGWALMTIDDGYGLEADRLVAQAQKAERVGFDCLWLGDHLLWRRPILEPVVTIGYLAGRTKTIGLATGVAIAPLRQPLWLAKQFGTLERLAQGRLLRVGLGAGEYPPEFDAMGVDRTNRGVLLDESLTILRRIQEQEAASHTGASHSFRSVSIRPRPSRSTEIWVGGRGDQSVRRALELADGWLGIFLSPRRIREVVDRRDQQDGNSDLVVGVYLWGRIGEKQKCDAILSEYVRRSYGASPGDMRRYWLIGSESQVRETILELNEAGMEYIVIATPGPNKEEQISAWSRILDM